MYIYIYIYTVTRNDDANWEVCLSLLVSSFLRNECQRFLRRSPFVLLSLFSLNIFHTHPSTILDYTLDIIFYFPRTRHVRASFVRLFFFFLFIITVRGLIVSRFRLLFSLGSFSPNEEKTSTLIDESLTLFSFSLIESIARSNKNVMF